MTKKLSSIAAAVLAATLLVSSPASAQLTLSNRACTMVTFSLVVEACAGFYSGNELQSSAGGAASADELTALQSIGFGAGPANVLEKFSPLNGSTSFNFVNVLNGATFIGIHFGNGAQYFNGTPEYNGNGGGTAFFRLTANNTDIFTLNQILVNNQLVNVNGSSGISLYRTGTPTNVVPEPSTYALMAAGLAGLGLIARRRRA